MRLAHVLLGLIAMTTSSSGFCQDLVWVAPQAARVEYEDARIRVVRLRVAAHASLPTHDRPARVVVSLTANDVRLSHADGRKTTTRTNAGNVAWSEPGRREVTNLADSPLENIIVELKTVTEPAKAAAHPPEPLPPEYLDEPRHRWLFENQYVRVYDVRIPPGETTELHRHSYDSVVVFVSGGLVATQTQGQPWGEAEKVEAGSMAVGADSHKPYAHRVRNDGKTEYHAIVVQLIR